MSKWLLISSLTALGFVNILILIYFKNPYAFPAWISHMAPLWYALIFSLVMIAMLGGLYSCVTCVVSCIVHDAITSMS